MHLLIHTTGSILQNYAYLLTKRLRYIDIREFKLNLKCDFSGQLSVVHCAWYGFLAHWSAKLSACDTFQMEHMETTPTHPTHSNYPLPTPTLPYPIIALLNWFWFWIQSLSKFPKPVITFIVQTLSCLYLHEQIRWKKTFVKNKKRIFPLGATFCQ